MAATGETYRFRKVFAHCVFAADVDPYGCFCFLRSAHRFFIISDMRFQPAALNPPRRGFVVAAADEWMAAEGAEAACRLFRNARRLL